MTVFNVITNDDSYGVAVVGTTYQDVWVGMVFYFAMVFGINYLIYGLVSAVLLDAFSSQLENTEFDEQEKQKKLEVLGIKDPIDVDKNDDTLVSENDLEELNQEDYTQ